MIEKYKCIKCQAVYEILWDDSSEYYSASVEDSDLDEDEDSCWPQHCPFCGESHDGGSDEDYDFA